MCGIFGLIAPPGALSGPDLRRLTDDLFRLSESRGRESAGLALSLEGEIWVHKEPRPASAMICGRDYDRLHRRLASRRDGGKGGLAGHLALLGQTRLVTNGSQLRHDNNQPVVKDGVVAVHNGIIVNDEELWGRFPDLERRYQTDTEVAASLVRCHLERSGSLVQALRQTFSLLEGTASLGLLLADSQTLALATNNGSLYGCPGNGSGIHLFASESYILTRLLSARRWRRLNRTPRILHLEAGWGWTIDPRRGTWERFSLNGREEVNHPPARLRPRPIVDLSPKGGRRDRSGPDPDGPLAIPTPGTSRYEIDPEPIRALRRCTRCILPETMPFIEFDEQGVCNYCRTYRKQAPKGAEALSRLADDLRRPDGRPECLVAFSGGRDSSFSLHYASTVLGLKTVAYTYDWGMITDLARRNQARLCGRLGVEHVLVSADIGRKRRYIRKNVLAWLKRPRLGTIPLFMAGDKQYYYFMNRLRQRLGTPLVFNAINPLELTHFKTGFCGVRPHLELGQLPLKAQARLVVFYGREYLANPAYFNRSVVDTLGAFFSYYLLPHRYLSLYDYLPWDEAAIERTLTSEYGWELAGDTRASWRIGDGTAALYNYIYYLAAGFTENDTLRSNQIREGMMSRERALEAVEEENRARLESIAWYCWVVGLPMADLLDRIRSMERLYPH